MSCPKTVSTAIYASVLVFVIARGHAAPRQILPNHVPAGIRESRRVGPLSRVERLSLAVGLPLRNGAELDSFLEQVADPGNPNYRRYMSAREFARRFGPTQQDYDKLIVFLESSGFEISGKHPNRMILDVTGSVASIQNTFHVNMSTWEHGTRGSFFAPDRDPWLDIDVAVLDVTGLDNFVRPRPMDVKAGPLSFAAPLVSGSGPSGLFIGKDFRTAYAPGVTRTGAGQTVGLFELDGFYAGDVLANFKQAGLPPVSVQTVLLDGSQGAAGDANVEVILDIMMAAYMAPGASIVVYEGYNWNDILNRMATDNIARQLSSSWCFSPINATTEQIFKQMIAQGQSLLQASGDSGAYSGWIMPPSDNPNVTVVGGTALTTAGPGGQWLSESAWGGSGGGVSTTYGIPSYQQNMNLAALGGSNTMRNIPDVALTAAVQMFLIEGNGRAISVGGTSAAAPLWAGFLALANEQAAATGKSPVGFLNPAIYALGVGAGSNYAAGLHDIITGSNGFAAVTGFDLATGWGTPAGQPLIDALTSTPSTPSFALAAPQGKVSLQTGSSATATVQVTAQNGFSGSVTLSVSGLPNGLTATFGSLSSSGASTLTLAAGAAATAGNSTLTVTGHSGNLSATVAIPLAVISPLPFSLTTSVSTLSVLPGAAVASIFTVTPKSGFTGKVSLSAAGLPAGVTASFNPVATATTSTVTLTATSAAQPGTSAVMVTGTAGTSSTSVSLALTVKAGPGFTLAASPASVSVLQGTSASSTISLTAVNGFSGSAKLAIAGLPPGMTAAFSPASTASTSKLTFTATAAVPAGSGTATITATSGSISAQTTVALTVPTPPGFKLSCSTPIVNVAIGGNVTASFNVLPQGGFAGTVALSATGLPTGVTASFHPATTATAGTITITVAGSAAAKTSQLTVQGTSGSLTASLPIALTVMPLPDFAVTLSPAVLTVVQGGAGASAFFITPANGFAGAVTLSAAGLPGGVTASFSALTTSGPFLGKLTAAGSTAAGTSKITVTATSGALSHASVWNLTVVAPSASTAIVDLSPYYNVPASAIDSVPFTNGGLDALGRSYSGVLLGASQSVAGTLYSLGPMGVSDAVSGVTASLPPGQFTTLKLLAAGLNGPQPGQTFTLTYTDGTTSAFTQSLSDWYTPQNYAGETKAVSTKYRDNSTGTTDGRSFNLYGYSFPLSGGKIVSSVTLPQNRNVVVLAMTLAGSVKGSAASVVDLSKAFTGAGITSDGKPFTGGLDGVGYAYSGSLLQSGLTFNNLQFQLGGADQANVVSGSSKAIALPGGKYSSLLLLATTVNGARLSQPFKVSYTDGSSATFTQSLSDWFNPAGYPGEAIALAMPYRNAASGVKDNRPFALYQYAFALTNSKTVSSITLPADSNVKVFAISLKP